MGRKAWLRPRIKKLVKPHLVRTKSGKVTVVDSYLHDYPHKDKEPKKTRTKKGEESNVAKPKRSKMQEDLEKARKELACKLNA